MAFKVPTSLSSEETSTSMSVNTWCSGYTEQEEHEIRARKALIDSRNLEQYPVTLEEFKHTIAPWFRINRTEEFKLHPEKLKTTRVGKEPKEPKIKKLTKAQLKARISELIIKKATTGNLTAEEQEFFDREIGVAIL